jgi:hypothetical protein
VREKADGSVVFNADDFRREKDTEGTQGGAVLMGERKG